MNKNMTQNNTMETPLPYGNTMRCFANRLIGPAQAFEKVFPLIDWFTAFQIKWDTRPQGEELPQAVRDEHRGKLEEMGSTLRGLLEELLTAEELLVLARCYNNYRDREFTFPDQVDSKERMRVLWDNCSHPGHVTGIVQHATAILFYRSLIKGWKNPELTD
jgi:hypothetical protein